MNQFVVLFLVAYVIERVFETFWNREKIKGEVVAPYTLYLLVGTYALMVLIVFWERLRQGSQLVSSGQTLVGILLILISIGGRNWAIKTLGPYHSIQIEIRSNHQLIQSGPYRLVRNPYYLSNIVEAIGLPLAANARFVALLSLFVYVPLLVFRMILEERALERKFPDSFAAYSDNVPRILPKLFGG
jgi:protein-S-isoprenylcysteine O-methyltransferase Ste14